VEVAGIANQGRGIPEEGVAGFAAAIAAVRREFRIRGNFGKHDAADVHIPREREFAALYRRKDSRRNCRADLEIKKLINRKMICGIRSRWM